MSGGFGTAARNFIRPPSGGSSADEDDLAAALKQWEVQWTSYSAGSTELQYRAARNGFRDGWKAHANSRKG